MSKRIAIGVLIWGWAGILMQCKKDSAQTMETDQVLLARSSRLGGMFYYKDDTTIHRSSPQSAHAGYFRVRFNNTARTVLTDGGKLPDGKFFPEGSLVVKELHNDSTGNNISGYAVMEKLPSDIDAAEGWVWAEYVTNSQGYKVGGKGAICTGCHSMNDRDKIRVFNLFP